MKSVDGWMGCTITITHKDESISPEDVERTFHEFEVFCRALSTVANYTPFRVDLLVTQDDEELHEHMVSVDLE